MVAVMHAADDAERRGDAAEALAIMAAHPLGSDGKPFWRTERVIRLQQLLVLEPWLPPWAISRWILAQAKQSLTPANHGIGRRALEVAVELRGGPDALVGVDECDARAKVMDHDWVYRQLLLYEYGGLVRFLRTMATPDLLVGSHRIHDWARAPMRVLRWESGSHPVLQWRDLVSGDLVDVLDLGASAMVDPGDCVLGRVVPAGSGAIFEDLPLWVPDDVATDVALDPDGWLQALRRGLEVERSEEDQILVDTVRAESPVTDVPDMVWQLVALTNAGQGCRGPITPEVVVNAAAQFVRAGMAGALAPAEGGIDPWPCLAAALLDPAVLDRLECELSAADGPGLLVLADRLAEPASDVCRAMAAVLDAVA